MATAECWKNYHSPNMNKGTDEDIIFMMHDLVHTIYMLEKIYTPDGARLVTVALIMEYQGLKSIANARGLNYPSLMNSSV